jgi:hypothetical protein
MKIFRRLVLGLVLVSLAGLSYKNLYHKPCG